MYPVKDFPSEVDEILDFDESFKVDIKTGNISDNDEIIIDPVFESSDIESGIVELMQYLLKKAQK